MIKQCLNCNKDFDPPKGRVDRGFGKYCSHKCYSLFKIGKESTKPKRIEECLYCHKRFRCSPSNMGKYCSGKCSSHSPKINTKHQERRLHSRGYVLTYKRGHSRGKQNFVYEHILVMEQSIGRRIQPPEEIHHINGIKSDNRIENLKLCANHLEHIRYEKGWWLEDRKWFKKCPGCQKIFEVNKNNFWQRKNGEFLPRCKECSNSCHTRHEYN